jgi:probable non-F420 flavinoid oxidoreductase
MIIGYHASHEQFPPSALLTFVRAAEDAGFQAVMTSDHITPWSVRQGNSGNNWAWLGAALASTSIPFGTLAIPGGWRYHPVVLAHLVGTLAEMFPDRLSWIAVGSGEAMNESVVGKGWPDKAERNERLKAGADVIRSLLQGETVDEDRPWFSSDAARLWSIPRTPPAIFGAAITTETAVWMGPWTDGVITTRKPVSELREFAKGYEENRGSGKPRALQLQISWGSTVEEARLAAWDQWRCAVAPPDRLPILRRPHEFDNLTHDVTPPEMDDHILIVTTGDAILQAIADCRSCGFQEIYIHNVSRDQIGFMRFMTSQVLPHVD